MATNAQLRSRIEELAEELKLDPIPWPEAENNRNLAELKDELEARQRAKRDREPKAVDGDADKGALGGPPSPAPVVATVSEHEYSIAPNHAIYTRRGRKFGGDEVKRDDLQPTVLASLVERGAILHNKAAKARG